MFVHLAIAILGFLGSSPAMAWGKTGHRITGAIADHYLSSRARTEINHILGTESLAEASNWPDFMRSSTDPFWQKTASPYHYVTVPKGKTYSEVGAPSEGDAVTALRRFSATLRNPKAPRADKQLALRFIVHIVGDLQQPLHTGNGVDHGGNEVPVTLFGLKTNLHSVWDSGLIDQEQLSYSEWTQYLLAKIKPQQVVGWSSPNSLVWIAESTILRDAIYPSTPNLSYAYTFQNHAIIEQQLEKGGLRIAAYLNRLFVARPKHHTTSR
ncbi:endonuclease [Sphingomonas metalli]|uniref:Endonuclease n=1 Tax=Sphingomonas metalli TaxID=1779358 RepID=A0A916X0H4_9SPHN|nr:S1/P1 nuclease [Sphingomonas metalli]GGB43739.1 endonuclease [Sphingomonas metalli]